MKIEKLSDSRIKVTLHPKDLEKWNVTYESLSTENDSVNDMFWHIIIKVAEETGVNLRNSRLLVEVARLSVGSCVMIITKKEGEKRYKYRRKNLVSTKTETFVYRLDSIDELTTFAKNNVYYCFLFSGKNSLYRIGPELVLILSLPAEMKKYVTEFNDRISEYADIKRKSELFPAYVKEHIKAIIPDDALKILYYNF